MKFRSLLLASAFVLGAGSGFAAEAPPAVPMLVRGTIASIDAKSVTITKADSPHNAAWDWEVGGTISDG